jgi:PucR C-terminal helix-turn-helix domain/GGDEF-like domain
VNAKSGSKAGPSGTGSLEALSEAIESGAGLPAAARAAAATLGASVALIDRASAVLAVADASSGEEERLLAGGEGVESVELRVAEAPVGELRYRRHGEGSVDAGTLRVVTTLLALEVERARSPEWASDRLASDFVSSVLDRDVTDRGDLIARAAELGCELEPGAGVVVARARPRTAQSGEWRERVLLLALRALRAVAPGSLAAEREGDVGGHGEAAGVAAIVPAAEDAQLSRAAVSLERELGVSLSGFQVTVAHSRRGADPVDLYRAGKEALLAANVAEAEGRALLAFEDTGAYRLMLPAVSEDPSELERFYEETVAPLAAYDEQYETELVTTIEAFLENDGSVTPTAERLFTHRHTIRYRLERVRELSGHDLGSTEGREKLSLGLKAMRVLGIASPRGPAMEPGAEAGKVRRKDTD